MEDIFVTVLVTLLAGLGAGLGTGFAGMSAAAVISPMLIAFLDVDPYMAVAIALASDVLASAVSAYTYARHRNVDVKHGFVMLVFVLAFTVVGSVVAQYVSQNSMEAIAVVLTFILGLRFIIHPVSAEHSRLKESTLCARVIKEIIAGMMIGFVCGFVGAGGGMMMLFALTSVLGYELKTAVGTSVFIMTFTALTGSVSHFALGGMPDDILILLLCMGFTLMFARIAALIANKASHKALNRMTGCVLVLLGIAIFFFSDVFKNA